MSDLIRKSDAVKVCRDHEEKAARQGRGDFIAHGIDAEAIAALPAVTVGVPVAHAYIVEGECEQIEWGAEYCLPDDPALTMLYAHPAPDPAAIREAALREAAAKAEDHLLNWANDLAETRDLYREALSTGKMNGRNISEALARKCARDFNERAEAVAESAEHTRDAILALIQKGADHE